VATRSCPSSGNRVVVGMFRSRNGVLADGVGHGGFWDRLAVVEVVTSLLFFPEAATSCAIGCCVLAGSWHFTWCFFTLLGIRMSVMWRMPKLARMIEVLCVDERMQFRRVSCIWQVVKSG